MANESTRAPVQSESNRTTLRIALSLNAAMFVVGMVAGLWAQSTGLIADAVDMLVDASTYALALLAVSRDPGFKRNAARWSGAMLLILGAGVVADVVRRGLFGSEPQGQLMMLFSLASLVVNVTVLRMLGRFRYGEVHLRAAWRETRADVLANVGVFASGLSVWFAGLRMTDLLMGLAIGLYVCKEAIEILRDAGQPEAGERRSFG